MERIRRLLKAVGIKHKEKEPTSTQSLPLKLVPSTEEISKKEEKRNVQKLDVFKDQLMDTEKTQNEPNLPNKHSNKKKKKKMNTIKRRLNI